MMEKYRVMKPQEVAAFKTWLKGVGASVLATTNEWELVRFDGTVGVSVIYFNKKGEMTFTGDSLKAFQAFKKGGHFRVAPRTKRKKVTPHIRTLRERDGDLCFYCFHFVAEAEESVEHLVPTVHHGPNHISNMVLAHARCNHLAGHLDVMSKIKIREKNRSAINCKGADDETHG